MSKISIILPVYNEEKKIGDVINSILNQSYQDIELIIVYLEGADNTLNVIQSFDDTRIKLIYQKEDNGPGGARNLGIENSTGDYIGFNECEIIDRDFYKNLYEVIEQDSSDIVVGTVTIIQNNKKVDISNYNEHFTAKSMYDKFYAFQSGTCFEKLFKTSFIKENNIKFAEYYRWEDSAFTIKAFYKATKISFVNNVNYVWHALTWSGEYEKFLIKSIPPVLDIILKEIDLNSFNPKTKKLFVKKLYKSFVRNYIYDIGILGTFIRKTGLSFYIIYRFIQENKKRWLQKIKRRRNND